MTILAHTVVPFSRMKKKKLLHQEALQEDLEDQVPQDPLAMPLKVLKEVHQEDLVELDHQEVRRGAVHQEAQREVVHQVAPAKEDLLKAGHQEDLREADHQAALEKEAPLKVGHPEALREAALQKVLTEALHVDSQ